MSNEINSSNFIRNIIINDLESGKHNEIITRFPPEPNGYLHIGHAKSILLNFGLAEEFHGKTHLRFDDTNPVKEDTEYVESIKEDVKWLGGNWDALFFASNYFDTMYEKAVLLIKKGLAYVCDLTPEEAKNHPKKNILMRALGANNPAEVDIFDVVDDGIEGILLSSDGLTSMLNETQIEKVIVGAGSLEEKVTRLIRKSNVRGGTDNISIACLMLNDEEGEL